MISYLWRADDRVGDSRLRLNLTKFTAEDIARMIEQGKRDTVSRVKEAKAGPADPGHAIAVRLTV